MKRITFTLLSFCTMAAVLQAQNPIVQTMYTADPAPMVYKDTLFLYTGHDESGSTWFTMKDWHVFSTTDMVNWTDRGTPLSLKTFAWARHDAWAAQCIERDGKFYWYVCAWDTTTRRMAIGVAVSDSPTGPFVDVLGKPLVAAHWGDIDPTVFIDDDGQAYLYWGNPDLWYIRLNKDMVSYDTTVGVVRVPLTKEGFHYRIKDADKRTSSYEEGPWLYKRKGIYYLLYPAGGVPEHLAYSTSPAATGPWTYGDTIMHEIKAGGAFTNHPGLVDYKGHSWLFYHNGALQGGGGFTRSVCADELAFDPDGSIPVVAPTAGIVKGVGAVDPFQRVEAETIAWEHGVETVSNPATGVYVTAIHDKDYIKVRNVNFHKRARSFKASVSPVDADAIIEIHADTLNGPLIGQLTMHGKDGRRQWETISCPAGRIRGIHDLFFVFRGGPGELFDLDWWQFSTKQVKTEKRARPDDGQPAASERGISNHSTQFKNNAH